MKLGLLIWIFLLILVPKGAAQGPQCAVPINTTVNNQGQIGNVFTAQTINVTVIMQKEHDVYSPTAELAEYKQKLEALLSKEKLLDQKELEMLARDQKLSERESKITQKEKSVASQEQKITDFEKQIEYYNTEFIRLESKVNKISASTSKQELAEAKEIVIQAKDVIKSSKCLAVDYKEDVKEFQDESGKKIYGFPLEKLKNDPNYVYIGEFKDGIAVIKKFNVYGYIDITEKVIIEYQYHDAKEFVGGFALVNRFNKWSIINTSGSQVAEVEGNPEEVKPLKSGLNLGVFSKKFALFNAAGKIISDYYDGISDYRSGTYRVTKNNKSGLMRDDGTVILPLAYDQISPIDSLGFSYIKKGAAYGMIKNEVLVFDALFDDKGTFLDKRKLMVKQNNKAGIFDIESKHAIVEPIYDKIELLNGSFTILKVWVGSKFGFLKFNEKSNKYNTLLNTEYDQMTPSSKPDLSWIKKGTEWFLLKSDFSFLTDDAFGEFRDFDFSYAKSKNLALVKKNGKWGVINGLGKYQVKPNYQSITKYDSHGYAFVEYDNKWGFVDHIGNLILAPTFDEIGPFNNKFHAKVAMGGKTGLIDSTGNLVISISYSDLKPLYDFNLIIASFPHRTYSGRWADIDIIIDFNEKTVLKNHVLGSCGPDAAKMYALRANPLYSNLSTVECRSKCSGDENKVLGILLLYKKDSWNVITPNVISSFKILPYSNLIMTSELKDTTSKNIIDYSGKIYFEKVKSFKELSKDYFMIKKDGGWGIVDINGTQFTDFKYENICDFKNEIAIVEIKSKQGAVNLKSAEIIPLIFKNVTFLESGNINIEDENGKKYLVDKRGDCIQNCEEYRKMLRDYYKNK